MTYTIRPVRPTDLAAVTEVEAIWKPQQRNLLRPASRHFRSAFLLRKRTERS